MTHGNSFFFSSSKHQLSCGRLTKKNSHYAVFLLALSHTGEGNLHNSFVLIQSVSYARSWLSSETIVKTTIIQQQPCFLRNVSFCAPNRNSELADKFPTIDDVIRNAVLYLSGARRETSTQHSGIVGTTVAGSTPGITGTR